jgi:hypothetical protein
MTPPNPQKSSPSKRTNQAITSGCWGLMVAEKELEAQEALRELADLPRPPVFLTHPER